MCVTAMAYFFSVNQLLSDHGILVVCCYIVMIVMLTVVLVNLLA